MLTAGIAVDKATLNFDKVFSYIVPPEFEKEIKVGSIALVPFGAGNKLRVGIVLSLQETEDAKRLKSVVDVKTEDTVITPFSLKLIEYIKETTFSTYYEAVRTVVPYGGLYKIKNNSLVNTAVIPKQRVYKIAKDFTLEKLTKKQEKVYQYLCNSHKSIKQICEDCNVTKAVVDTMVKNGILTFQEADALPGEEDFFTAEKNIVLSLQQQKTYNEIIAQEDKKPHLIYGVTSSGKSMVFLKLIERTIQNGDSAMLLVPEISLTPQMINLVKSYFGNVVSVIHSRLTPLQKLNQYRKIQQGQAKVVVGTRSGVFAPIDSLKLIIIDEEHEKTFKSESAPRYSAIRVAAFIAKEKGAKLVLASATPSIESFYLAQNGFYHLHTMEQRYNNMPMPNVEIVDMRAQGSIGDVGVVSDVIIKYLKDNIRDNKQSIILINRRGYSTVAVCNDCRQTLQCSDCSVNLVKHKKENCLSCHYCGKSYPVEEKCPHCGGQIQYIGYGTQKVEEYILSCLPKARILRMDADTTQKTGSHQELLSKFGKGEYDILIGTQMVAKGLNFKDVNLVCVLGIDGALGQLSYNSNENAFNLLTQVIGRAGRQSENSKAVVQTYDSGNPIIKLAQKSDYKSFYKDEIAFRRLNIYPPFCTMYQVAFTHEKEVQAARDSAKFLDIIKELSQKEENLPLVALGPVPFQVAMVSKTYRYRLTIKCKNTKQFRLFLQKAIDIYLKNSDNKSAIYININPVQE